MKSFTEAGRFGSRALILAASTLAAIVAGSSGAQAQVPANCSGTITGPPNLGNFGGGAVSSAVAGVIGSVNTAFLTQQGSAFVSAPVNPVPGQPGGGIWARALGGEVDVKSTSTNSGSGTLLGVPFGSVNTSCANNLHQSFSGVQVGTDISKLNLNGWNFHLGTTAGFLASAAKDDPNRVSKIGIEVPFFGAYLVATYGRFFADIMVRKEFYNMTFDSPSLNLNTQTIGAHGHSVSASVGYNYALANNWFIEPSAGFVWSTTKVDAFNSAVPDGNGGAIGATTKTDDVDSVMGRLSLRVGTTISTPNVLYQPFATASVFHEFAGDVVATSAFCPTCAFVGPVPFQFTNTTRTSRVGTYGQFSLGLAGQIVNTGWLGFVRADYKHGDNVDGYSGNVGLRYQFAPDAIVAPVKFAKAPLAPVVSATNWTGFYMGVFAGAAAGRSDIAFANDPGLANTSPHVFGPLGGIQAGYNYQVNNWVFGVEGDFGLARIFGARTCGADDGTDAFGMTVRFNPFYQNCNDRMNWMATAAARLGYSYGRTLFYVKGGAAWADGRSKVDCIDAVSRPCLNVAGNQYPTFNANNTEYTYADYNRVGWMIGYGTEFDLGRNWSAKAEYNYIQFGKQTKLASDGETLLYSNTSISQVKVGLNYRFNRDVAVVAADAPAMYTKSPLKAPVVSAFNWTGFYIGGNVGGAISSKNWEFYDEFGTFTQDGLPGFAGEGTHAATGPIIGGQAGYRWQTGRVVLGAEAQGNWANVHGKNESILFFAGGFGDVNQTRLNGLGIFTGQVGYTAFDTLLYVKGGAVVVGETYDVFDRTTGVLKASLNDTRWGAAVGVGLEYAFTSNVTAGIDYVHGFMGSKTVDIPDVIFGGIYETERIRQRLDLVTLRLNYKFGGPSVVVAKY